MNKLSEISIFPNVKTVAYYDPLSQTIALNEIERSPFEADDYEKVKVIVHEFTL